MMRMLYRNRWSIVAVGFFFSRVSGGRLCSAPFCRTGYGQALAFTFCR